MIFDEWADRLDLRAAAFEQFPPADAKKPWRCDGPCGQLMYGQERKNGWNYPTPEGLPVGYFLSEEYPRVCDVCWNLYSVLKDRSHWTALSANDNKARKRLSTGGNYLST
jgi:hypothetical protein